MAPTDVVAWIALVVVFDGLAALAAGAIPERWITRSRPALFGFAGGMLLVSAITELGPTSYARLGTLALALGAGAMVVLGTVEHLSGRRDAHRASPVSPRSLLVSDGLHNFADGIAIASAFLVSLRLGAYTSAAVILHELPEELADYALLRAAGMSRRRALLANALVQLTSALGAASVLLLSSYVGVLEPAVLALAAGMFAYLAIFDLGPEVVRSRTGLVGAVAGAVVALLG